MSFYRIFCITALSLSAIFFCAREGQARPEMASGMAKERFAAMDADQDGRLSREEFFAAQPNMKDSAFDALDSDRDGSISLEEWLQFSAGHGRGDQAAMPPHDGMTMPPQGVNATAPHGGMTMPPQGGKVTAPHDGAMTDGKKSARPPELIRPSKEGD